ncbi:MAG: hypothetical protein AVDCRST_MAG93-408, partial [uncultured Chloroflexia bacterium]
PSSRFWEEERAELPPIRGRDNAPSAISLVFADMPFKRRRSDKELIALVDDVNRQLEDPDDDGEVVLQAIVPSWFCNATPKVIGTGGPGARPVAAPPLDEEWWSSSVDNPHAPFGFHSATLTQLDDRQSGRRHVEVAILDTAPSEEQLAAAYAMWGKQHPLLRSLLHSNDNGERRLRATYAADFLAGTGISLPHDTGIRGHEYTMEDHGLFAAGIIHSLAPEADLHLVEVLSQFGVGSLETIARGVETALERRRDPNGALVINCSFMLSLPRPKRADRSGHPAPNFPWVFDDDSPLLRAWALPLRLVCERAISAGAIVTAAAGNDAELTTDRSGLRPPARYPAAFRSVMGVGALTTDGAPAGYSNFSDEPTSKGLVTFGGDVSVSAPEVSDPLPLTANADYGVLGVYTGELPNPTAMLPARRTGKYPRPLPNHSGWARWAGTSFATPVISGALARAIGQGTPATQAEQTLRDAEAAVSSLGEQTFTVLQG